MLNICPPRSPGKSTLFGPGVTFQRPLILALLVLGLSVFLLISLQEAGARTVVVAEDGTGDETSLSAATYKASEGDTILVRSGNYSGTIYLKNNLTITGEDPENCRILFKGSYDRLHFQHTGVKVENLNITTNRINTGYLVSFSSARDCSILNCSIYSRNRDLINFAGSCHNITLKGNSFWKTSLSQASPDGDYQYLRSFSLVNNTLNGKPLHYLVDEEDLSFTGSFGGFILVNCSRIEIRNAWLLPGGNGVQIYYSNNISVLDSRLDCGIHLPRFVGSQDVLFQRNTISEPAISGDFLSSLIFGWNSNRLRIRENNFTGCGFWLGQGEDNKLEGNIFSGKPVGNSYFVNTRGIVLYQTRGVVVRNNEMEWDGISIRTEDDNFQDLSFAVHDISGNVLDKRPIYYYLKAQGEQVPSDAGQVILVESRDMLLANLQASTASRGVFLINSPGTTVRNCSLEGSSAALRSEGSRDFLLENCSMTGGRGLELIQSPGALLRGNNISNAKRDGFYLLSSPDSRMMENSIFRSGNAGIYLDSSDTCLLEENQLLQNQFSGVFVARSRDVRLQKNQLLENVIAGVYLAGFFDNLSLTGNSIADNFGFGIQVDVASQVSKVEAEDNWWGNETGPYHPSRNPDGLGNKVLADFVDFDPWTGGGKGSDEGTGASGDGEMETLDQGLPVLIFILVLLFGVLVVLVRLPEERFPPAPGKHAERRAALHGTGGPKKADCLPGPGPGMVRCPNCKGCFDVSMVSRSQRFLCHFCSAPIDLEATNEE